MDHLLIDEFKKINQLPNMCVGILYILYTLLLNSKNKCFFCRKIKVIDSKQLSI